MKPGQVSGLLRSANGFHIIRLNDRRGGVSAAAQGPTNLQQTRVRHILLKTNELVSENEARNRLRTLKERLENKADFASSHCIRKNDPAKGGDLVWLPPATRSPSSSAP